ncbi:MAG: adenylate/guanylate cyclase domain-containing protein [Magnetovibrionaceae bacterium]
MLPRFSISVRAILLLGFCGLSAVGMTLALALGLSTAVRNTTELLTDNIEGFVDRMASEVEGRLKTIEQRTRWAVARIEDGSINVQSPISEETEFFFQTVLASTPGTNAIGVIHKDGQFRGWAKGQPGHMAEDWSGDPGVMDWLKEGETKPEEGWGPPIWIESLDSAAIVYQVPLFGPDGYFGYFVYPLPISDFSLSLARIDPHAFILFGRDEVLAHPLMIDWRPDIGEEIPSSTDIYNGRSALIPLADLGDPILEEIWTAEELDFAIGRGVNQADFGTGFTTFGDRELVFIYRTLEGLGPKPLTVGTYFDANTADSVIDRMGIAAVAGGIVIIIAVLLGLFVARAIGRPIEALATASSLVEAGRFDGVSDLPRSHVSELNRALSSFEGMVRGLEEKEIIRRTLGRYVPESIADKLMQDDGSLAPVQAEATILFADVADFTALTEDLGPSRIVDVLNAYFSRMTEIIEAEGGVITQFQGDAILAIFNVPIGAEDHPERACRAAVRMRDAAETETFSGQAITCRIGINTGWVVAGAVGAEGRLTYTVHGDAVNRAARVEAMNKETGTSILITEATAAGVRGVNLRDVGEMEVRGQSGAVRVFTIDHDSPSEGGRFDL